MLTVVALLTASLIWGATAPVMKWALEVVPPATLAFLRFAIASAILLPVLWRFRKIDRSDWGQILTSALLGITFNIIFFFFGLKLTFAINAALIIATIPIFTLIAASIFLKEKLSARLVGASVLAFFGLIAITGPPILTLGPSHFLGVMLLILSALSWVGFEVASKKLLKIYSPFTLIFHITWIGTVTFLPFAIFESFLTSFSFGQINQQALVGILYGGVFSSTIAYTAWQWGLARFAASEAGFFLYLEPISAVIVSIWLLNEKITPPFLLGASLVILAVGLAEHKRKEHPLHKTAN